MRDAARPRFEVVSKGPDALVGGTSTDTTSFELFARGRVPELRVQVAHMRLNAPAATAVEVAGGGGSSAVYVTVNAMRILPQPLCSRRVQVKDALSASSRAAPADLRFDTMLFEVCERHGAATVSRTSPPSPTTHR
eukprot:4953104-Prymnesium_polylepis.1